MQGADWFWVVVIASGVVYFASRSTTEGAYETSYISCEKPDGAEKWRSRYPGRWGAIREDRYEVSFQSQLVVSAEINKLRDCTVFDRNNWRCGVAPVVRDGDMQPMCSDLVTPSCLLPLGAITHTLVYVAGSDWMCRTESNVLDVWHRASQSEPAS